MRTDRASRGWTAVLLVAIALAALAMAGCGGGSDASSTASAGAKEPAPSQPQREDGRRHEQNGGAGSTQASTSKKGHRPAGHAEADSAGHAEADSGGGGHKQQPKVAPLKVSGGGSSQFKVKGGDNSVQEYGSEASESELSQAAEAVHSFFVARIRGEWASACALLAASERESVEKLTSESSGSGGKGCPAALAAFTKQVPPSVARELTTVDAASLRHDGDQAFLIYTGPPGRTVYAMPLRQEEGAWRLGAIDGAALPGT